MRAHRTERLISLAHEFIHYWTAGPTPEVRPGGKDKECAGRGRRRGGLLATAPGHSLLVCCTHPRGVGPAVQQ